MIRVLKFFEEPVPRGRSSHADLPRLATAPGQEFSTGDPVERAVRRPFAPALFADLRELLRFRHFAMHGYEEFDLALARPAAEAAARVAAALPAAAEQFGRDAGLLPPT